MTTLQDRRAGNDGVSESIGFLLIFTMVIVGIGLVTLYGYPMLLQQQTSADKQIMEKNMIVLQNDMKSLAYKTVPYKETSLNIGGGSLTAYNLASVPAVSSMHIYDKTTGAVFVDLFSPGDLRYSSTGAGVDISLQNGAVVMRDHVKAGSVMLAQPRWFYDARTNTMVVNLIAINSTSQLSRAGVGTVQMAMGETSYSVATMPITDEIYLKYTPDLTPDGQDYSVAWGTYFTNTLGMTDRTLATELPTRTYQFKPVTTLVIKKYEVIITSV